MLICFASFVGNAFRARSSCHVVKAFAFALPIGPHDSSSSKSFLLSNKGSKLTSTDNAASFSSNQEDNDNDVVTTELYCNKEYDALLPRDFPRRLDVLIALEAVRKACNVIRKLQPEFKDSKDNAASANVVSKSDASPVTVADFSSQAIVLRHLRNAFGRADSSFIAEEDSKALWQDENLAQLVLNATGITMQNNDLDLLKKSIDLGKEYNTWTDRPSRVWCLDPIDGTKGFLRGKRNGGQYCVALALLENGVPTIGILGCPNLPTDANDFDYEWKEGEQEESSSSRRGCIFVASRGGGCYQLPLNPTTTTTAKRCHVASSNNDKNRPSEGRFCIGVEKFSDPMGTTAEMAKILHGDGALSKGGEILLARRIDSQAKYGVISRGGAEYYVRLPRPGYVEWIWDHAAGNVVLTEAGGTMTDTNGEPIDFSLGPKMSDTVKGVLGSNGGVFHDALVEAYQRAMQSNK